MCESNGGETMRKGILACSILIAACGSSDDGGSSNDGGPTVDGGGDVRDGTIFDAEGPDTGAGDSPHDAPFADVGPTLPEGGTAVVTFHSIGLYWTPPSAPSGDVVKMRYRRARHH